MFRVIKEIQFSYGHRLINYEGKCAHLHGHNARVQIELSSERLTHQGMVMDFFEIKKAIGSWINEVLDHKMILSESDPLAPILQKEGEPVILMKDNPTAEAIARYIFDQARHMRLPVSRVTLWETPTSAAIYHE